LDRALRIGILEGDDIGLEVVPETIKVMRAAAAKAKLAIDWHALPIGRKAFDDLGGKASTREMGDAIAAEVDKR